MDKHNSFRRNENDARVKFFAAWSKVSGNGTLWGRATLTRDFSERSAQHIRNVMQDLEYMGLLVQPPMSARAVSRRRWAAMVRDA